MREDFSKIAPEMEDQASYLNRLRRSVSVDMVSGLLNRDATERFIKERLENMAQGETCALFIVDLDNFKQVNDILGHPAGDEAIRQAAEMLSSLFRANDIVGRLGGDEFAIFLQGDVTEALVLEKAASICEKVQLALGDEKTVNVTVSVGVHLAAKGQKFEGLYRSADLALYKAKKAGKHQFYLKSQDTVQSGKFRPVNVITLSALLENMESGVALLEMGDVPRVLYVSPSFCRIIGTDVENLALPKPLSELIHPDDLEAVLSVFQKGLLQGQVVESTHRVRANGGKDWLWWQVRAAKIEYNSASPVMLVTATDVSKLKETQQGQEERIRRLQTAFDLTARLIWEVDLERKTFRSDVKVTDGELSDGEALHFPDDLIKSGLIHPDSVTRFRLFAQELLNGSARGFGNFAIRRKESGCYGWFSVSYQMLFDDVGRAIRAVGVLEDLPSGFTGGENWPPDRNHLPENLMADLVMRMCADLETDRVESLWIEGSDLSSQAQDNSCSEFLRLEKQQIFCRGSQKEFVSSFDRNTLLQLYRDGQRWLCAEYRRADRSGSIRWVRHILYLTEEPVSRHVYLFAYMIWLDPDRRFARVIRSRAKRDGISRLYDRESIQRMAETLFSDRKSGNRAVAVLQINGMEEQPDSPEQERLFYGISAGLSLVLGGSCLLGQYSPHQIVAVFPDVTERDGLRRRLEESIAALRHMLAPEPACRTLRFVTGFDLMPAATANYRVMLVRAVQACASRWNAATDTVIFARDREDQGWTHLYTDSEGHISIRRDEMTRPLSGPEKDLALDSVSAMLAARSLDTSLLGVLRAIGEYYHADRVYSLLLMENCRTVVMTFEWTNGVKQSIQKAVSGMPLERFPLLVQCMQERAPVFLSRQGSAGAGEKDAAESPWNFTVFPLMRSAQQAVDGFLCIENAQKHPADAAVFSTLIPLMLQQRERFNRGKSPFAVSEQLMNIPDLQAYIEALPTLNSEYYSAMGAVCLDIPGLDAVSGGREFEYGKQMLWYAAKAMIELFDPALLFRVRDFEFIAFCPNTTREAFLGSCGRLWSILQRRYPKQVRIGQAWSDESFTGEHLAEQANAAMKAAKADLFAKESELLLNLLDPVTRGAVQNAQFTVYFQPKVNMKTGALVGAEALVRRIGEDGTIIPPSQFIPLFEGTSAIRDLDLFILERSLAKMEQWRASGLGIVPLSVNLSRTTLAHPPTLASILAVQSRYPDIPASALELEITEYCDGIDTTELQELVERFRACGLHLSLDDFGSRYANLSLFTNVKFETVKLDKSLIANLDSNPISRMLVQDLVQICQTYGMNCVAEGVETAEQVSALLEIGCIYVQGFYYDRPLPAEEFERKYLRGRVFQPAGTSKGKGAHENI